VTEILNYISAWLTFLAAVFALCVFFFDLASKKKSNSPRGGYKRIVFPPSTLDGWLKKHFFPPSTVELW